MANPDKLLEEVNDATSTSDYKAVLSRIRDYNGSVPANPTGHDGRTARDLLDEAERKLSDGASGWNEASIRELLKEAIARIADAE